MPDYAVSVKEHLTPLLERQMTVWWLQDHVFREPKVEVVVEVNVPLCRRSAVHAVLCTLYSSVVADSMSELAYAGTLAGYSYSIALARVSGFQITMSGCVGVEVLMGGGGNVLVFVTFAWHSKAVVVS